MIFSSYIDIIMYLHLCVFVIVHLPFIGCLTFGTSLGQTPLDEVTENTYLKVVFPDGEENYVRNWECHDGIWAEDMHLTRQPNCVCVKGVYAIGTNLCDDDFKILSGDGHCFDVRGLRIRKFIPLTGRLGFKGKANTVFRADAPYFARLNSPTPTTSVPEPVHYIFRMNDPTEISVYARLGNGQAARLKCLPPQSIGQNSIVNPIMQITKLPDCSNEFRGPKLWCDTMEATLEYQWTFGIGQSWSRNGEIGNGERNSSSSICKSLTGGSDDQNDGKKNGRGKRGKRQKRWTPKKSKSKVHQAPPKIVKTAPPILDAKCNKFDNTAIEREEEDLSAEHFYQPDDVTRGTQFHSASFYQKEVNMQNRRIGHHLRQFFLNGDNRMKSIPRFIDFPEFKYIQIAKEILKVVCPADHVPPLVVDFLIRVFRVLYVDSSPDYPYPVKFNKHEHSRTLDALNSCKDDAMPVAFVANTSCPDVGILVTNQSVNASDFIIHDLESSPRMPGNVAFNGSSMDISIELVWKLTLLTHIYCLEKFSYHPFDFSLFFVKMEAFLRNPLIMFRWFYPGQLNRLLQFFLMSHNLELFAKGVDRCVETIYAGSPHNLPWAKRPPELHDWMAKPRILPHDIGKVFNSPTGNFGKGRKKRFYLQDDMWNKEAYCLQNTNAPYTEIRTSTFLTCKKKPIWFDNTD